MKINEIVSDDIHKPVRSAGYAKWGHSHSGSRAITGQAARLMGIPDYEINPHSGKKQDVNLATAFLTAIANSPGSLEPLYHGFQNRRQIKWQIGQVLRLPLTATSGEIDSASYGMRLDPKDNEGPPTCFEFPVGTPMAGYAKWKRADAEEFGHNWGEAIVAGEFQVQGIRTEHHYDWRKTPFTVVTLKFIKLGWPN